MTGPLVTAIVPAFDAADTIDETLRSIRSQTYAELEILVVDDGSTDATPDIVLRHAQEDARVRLIRQANAGVATARNRGLAEARGEFVAPIDADDLWAPSKIEAQVAAITRPGSRVGLVYTWSSSIDENSMVTGLAQASTDAGRVMRELCRSNIVGNGSAALVRTDAARATGGFDASLRAKGAEGCEDIAFYIRVAEEWEFGVVPEALTGYRQLRGSMSANGHRMFRSWTFVAQDAAARNPHYRSDLRAGVRNMVPWALARDARGGNLRSILSLFVRHPVLVARNLSRGTLRVLGRALTGRPKDGAGHAPGRFVIGEPRRTP